MHLFPQEDSQMVALIKQGDSKAFASIYKKYAKTLFTYVQKNINNKEEAEEIIQDIFVLLWERRDRLNISTLGAYLFSSVRYKIIRYFQHSKVKRKYEKDFKAFEIAYDLLNEPETKDSEALRELILNSVTVLPQRLQTVIKLRLIESLSNSEIAQRMNISKKSVELYISKAYTHLRTNCQHILE
jgi:RNA polymerase sigma-70 factor (family 1)